MQIIDLEKIKIAIAIVLTTLVLIIIFSIFRLQNGKKNTDMEETPVLQPAPDSLLQQRQAIKRLMKSKASYYIDENNEIIITTENEKTFKIDANGNIINVDDIDFSDSDNDQLNEILAEISQNFPEDNMQIELARLKNQTKQAADNLQQQKKEKTDSKTEDSSNHNDNNKHKSPIKRIVFQSKQSQLESKVIPSQYQNMSVSGQDYITLDTDMLSNSLLQTDWSKQNSQDDKIKFLHDFSKNNPDSYILTQNEIAPGTIIPITLITGVNSDLPGEIIAQTNTNVYDSLTSSKLLIAKGTKLIASYDSKITYGQQRILIAWTTLIRSDGLVMTLPGFQGTDNLGRSGYSGKVDSHFLQIAGSSLLSSIINLSSLGLSELLEDESADIVLNTLSDSVTSPAAELMQKSVNRQPTIIIEPGTQCKVLFNKKVTLPEQNNIFQHAFHL